MLQAKKTSFLRESFKMERQVISLLARAREIFDFRVHGCHIAFIQRACTLFLRVSRVPQGCHAFEVGIWNYEVRSVALWEF